jgi:hypothetical protein
MRRHSRNEAARAQYAQQMSPPYMGYPPAPQR